MAGVVEHEFAGEESETKLVNGGEGGGGDSVGPQSPLGGGGRQAW